MKILAALTDPGASRKYLDHVGLPSRSPPLGPAGQRRLAFGEVA
jgi:hypothetical protein